MIFQISELLGVLKHKIFCHQMRESFFFVIYLFFFCLIKDFDQVLHHFKTKMRYIWSIYGRVGSFFTHGTYIHSSEIKSLCLMECPSKMFQNLPYFWSMKAHVVFSFFIFQKCGKFWSVSLGHFIKHKHLISEECIITFT